MTDTRSCPECHAADSVVTTSILIKAGSSLRSFHCGACDHRWMIGDGLFAGRSTAVQADGSEAGLAAKRVRQAGDKRPRNAG
jgi:hypothetical protein